jgi:enolase
MKMNTEGSYFTPNDNSINDTVKVLEDILKELNEGTKVTIGIDCNANNFYSDAAKKYEMDGFKTPIENDQLVDFYLKYLLEHPLITYLEDPMSELDSQGWKRLISKFEGKTNIAFAGKNLFMDNLHSLKDVKIILILYNF